MKAGRQDILVHKLISTFVIDNVQNRESIANLYLYRSK
jgi:hypothetical protein